MQEINFVGLVAVALEGWDWEAGFEVEVRVVEERPVVEECGEEL